MSLHTLVIDAWSWQAERCPVRCGDDVFTLAWEPGKQRVLLRTYDPGFYFPEWDGGEQDSSAIIGTRSASVGC
ncbi:hypothetical protein [Actinacidiphila oryziradicis]|uniref:Uncharacterized protein n=1 Tax=Actinacidiphila oryziradicis TaxID=2571141 RepID=A0A4U0SIE6_9ACTN|nr:hypothetical protein [Actinacidiphila oryziradicis]TKA09494.1 hypothetical protein FCI23_21830 [Actinacidiphila oryziradicis]